MTEAAPASEPRTLPARGKRQRLEPWEEGGAWSARILPALCLPVFLLVAAAATPVLWVLALGRRLVR